MERVEEGERGHGGGSKIDERDGGGGGGRGEGEMF